MERLKGKIPDLVVSIMLLSIGVVGLVMAFDFPTKSGKWPIIVMSMLVFLMVLYLASFLYGLRPEAPSTDRPSEHGEASKIRIVFNIGIITFFIILAPYLGLFVTTALYLFAHMLFLGVRPVWLVAVCSLGSTAVIYGFFGHLLGVYLPGALLF
ncbi:MAG: hypothetical protein COB24_00130 [Hyphomicrobiales bacterium]|nr:MAG: hypothetical protein COB24_00130 [Hyphomicrobiales bacterium]